MRNTRGLDEDPLEMSQRLIETMSEAEGAVFHLWQDGRFHRYRAYLDLPPF